MNTVKIRVTGTNGKRMVLRTDDTLTLAFPGMVESTPETLAEKVSLESLENIVDKYQSEMDINEKAYNAVCLSRKSRN